MRMETEENQGESNSQLAYTGLGTIGTAGQSGLEDRKVCDARAPTPDTPKKTAFEIGACVTCGSPLDVAHGRCSRCRLGTLPPELARVVEEHDPRAGVEAALQAFASRPRRRGRR